MKKAVITSLLVAGLPFIANAQELGNIRDIVLALRNIIDILIPLVFALAILYFFWGLAQFILAAGDESAAASGRSKMIWGVVAIAVMASVWGLVYFLQDAFEIRREGAIDVDVLIPRGGQS